MNKKEKISKLEIALKKNLKKRKIFQKKNKKKNNQKLGLSGKFYKKESLDNYKANYDRIFNKEK